MAIRTPFDLLAWFIGRLPLLAIAAGVLWIAVQGLTQLETYSFGTEFFVSNDATSNVLPTLQSNEQILLEALESGDLAAMEQALDQVEARQDRATAAAAMRSVR